MKHCHACVNNHTPIEHFTWHLFKKYKSEFPTVECNMLHSAFQIPVDTSQLLRTNFTLSEFQVIVIDEVSMISCTNMLQVIKTLNSLPVFPILLLCGDRSQLQPFERVDQATATDESFFDCHDRLSRCNHFLFTEQTRCTDDMLNEFFNFIHHSTLTNRKVRQFF